MNIYNCKIELYHPSGGYLGEIIADNINMDIRTSNISTISFDIPEYINEQLNTTLYEILDNYEIVLSYGKDYSNSHRFVIVETPMNFSENGKTFSFTASSVEYELEKEIIKSWEGIEKTNYYREVGGNMLSIDGVNKDIALEDIEVYSVRRSGEIENHILLLQIDETGNPFYDKIGSYYVEDLENSRRIVFPQPEANSEEYNTINNLDEYYYKIYDNPKNIEYHVGYTGLTQKYVSTDKKGGAAKNGTEEINGVEYKQEVYYSKDGLKFEEVWNDLFKDNNYILEVNDNIKELYRSNFSFNNITKYEALKSLVESFEAEFIVECLPNGTRVVKVFKEYEIGENKGLVLQYGTYLKGLEKNIDSNSIVTSISGLGKDNMTAAIVSPTGRDWEDYSYYLDDYVMTESNSNFNSAISIFDPATSIDDLNFGNTFNFTSRWIDPQLALKIARWQIVRNKIHEILSFDSDNLSNLKVPQFIANMFGTSSLNTFKSEYAGLYKKRKDAIRLLSKTEEYLNTRYSNMQYYEILKEKTNESLLELNGDTTHPNYNLFSESLVKYTEKWVENRSKYNSYNIEVKKLTKNIYEPENNNMAYKFENVRNILDKKNSIWNISTDDLKKLSKFKKDYVFEDTTIDDELDLLNAMLEYLEENKNPKVTVTVDIVDFLAAQETEFDHDKIVLGDRVNILFEDFNIDLEAQIKEFTIGFTENSLSLVISTVKNYNKGIRSKFFNTVKRLSDINKNIVEYDKDKNRINKEQGDTLLNTIKGKESEMATGIITHDGKNSIILDSLGVTTQDIEIDHKTETVSINETRIDGVPNRLVLGNGALTLTSQSSIVEMSIENGFSIWKVKDRNEYSELVTEKEKVFEVTPEGDISFKGTIKQGTAIQFGNNQSATAADMIQYTLNITGGTRSLILDKDGNVTSSSMDIFYSSPKIGTKNATDVDYSWEAFGRMKLTGNSQNFQPALRPDYESGDTYVQLTVDFKEGSEIINTVTERVNVIVTKEGESGPAGPEGPSGKRGRGLNYRGRFNDEYTYYLDDVRTDIVYYIGSYYYRIGDSESVTKELPTNINYWAPMNYFESVATKLFMTQDGYIHSTLNIGSDINGHPGMTLYGGQGATESQVEDARRPYISIGQGNTQNPNSNGGFFGYNGEELVFKIGSNNGNMIWKENGGLVLNSVRVNEGDLSINQGNNFGFSNPGVFIGREQVSVEDTKVSFVNSLKTNYFKWDGSDLEIKTANFQLKDGVITATEGKIGSWNISGSATNFTGLYFNGDSYYSANIKNKIEISPKEISMINTTTNRLQKFSILPFSPTNNFNLDNIVLNDYQNIPSIWFESQESRNGVLSRYGTSLKSNGFTFFEYDNNSNLWKSSSFFRMDNREFVLYGIPLRVYYPINGGTLNLSGDLNVSGEVNFTSAYNNMLRLGLARENICWFKKVIGLGSNAFYEVIGIGHYEVRKVGNRTVVEISGKIDGQKQGLYTEQIDLTKIYKNDSTVISSNPSDDLLESFPYGLRNLIVMTEVNRNNPNGSGVVTAHAYPAFSRDPQKNIRIQLDYASEDPQVEISFFIKGTIT